MSTIRKTVAGLALALSTAIPTTIVAAPQAEAATSKWPTHAKVITNKNDFQNHNRPTFRVTVRAQDGHGRYITGRVGLYVNGRHQRTMGTNEWGWRTFRISRDVLPNNRVAKVVLVIKPHESRKRQVRFVRLWVTDRKAPRTTAGERVVSVARAQIGDPYVWGAGGPNTFDCSGLVAYSYRHATGKRVPHSSDAIRRSGHRVSRPRPGDVVWSPGHVSIYAGGGRVVEAAKPGTRVRLIERWQRNPVYLRF